MDAPNGPSAKEYYGYISDHIEKEVDLVNNRLSWMLSFQGFLFASISIVTSKESEATLRTFLRDAFSFAGIAVAVLTLIGVYASALQRDSLKRQWTNLKYQGFPPLSSNPLISTMGRITSFGIPITIITVWIAVWRGIR
jgi:hypothetical protein